MVAVAIISLCATAFTIFAFGFSGWSLTLAYFATSIVAVAGLAVGLAIQKFRKR